MTLLDRKLPPKGRVDTKINFLKAKSFSDNEKSPLYYIDQGIQNIVKIEVVFNAGAVFQHKKLVASLTNELLLEGASNYTSEEIAAIFDNEGAFLENSCGAETASFSLYCLTRSIKKLAPIFQEILFSANFLEEEFEHLVKVKKQKFLVNSEKVSFQAKNIFLETLLGESNSYSGKLEVEDFEKVDRQDLLNHYEKFYKKSPFKIFVAGKVETAELEIINNSFSNNNSDSKNKAEQLNLSITKKPNVYLEKKGAIQSAIRLGKVVVNRGHPDYAKLFLLNTVLGGYFGSRLMTNLREDKGYTYGIGSGIVSNKNLSYLTIATEVGASVTAKALKEIEGELNRLQEELLSERELQLVKNYMIGSIQRNFDGAFAAIDRFKMLEINNLDYTYYDNLIEEVIKVTPEELLATSKTYLNFSDFTSIIVGQLK